MGQDPLGETLLTVFLFVIFTFSCFVFFVFQQLYNIQRGVIWATTARSHRWFGVTGHWRVWTRDYCMYDLLPITDAAEITNHMIDKGHHVTLSPVTLSPLL